MTAAPERSPLSCRRAAAVRQSAEAIRAAAATAAAAALSYDAVADAADAAAGTTDEPEPHRNRAAWARTRADALRRLALRMWARADALESAAH
ncbi:hypothetical protein ACI8AC_12455 [Geodermatophilus sp. SYSU D00758]